MAKYEFELNDDQLEGLKKLGIVPVKDTSFSKMNDVYYYITGSATCSNDIFCDDSTDKLRLSIGNYFESKEEAEFELERLRVISEMKKFVSNVIHQNTKESRFYIGYSFCDKEIQIVPVFDYCYYYIYFASKEDARKCIESVGEERIKTYYLEVVD